MSSAEVGTEHSDESLRFFGLKVSKRLQPFFTWIGNIIIFVATCCMSVVSLQQETCETVLHNGSTAISSFSVSLYFMIVEISNAIFVKEKKPVFAILDNIYSIVSMLTIFLFFPRLDAVRSAIFQFGYVFLCIFHRTIASEIRKTLKWNSLLIQHFFVIVFISGAIVVDPIKYLWLLTNFFLGLNMFFLVLITYESWFVSNFDVVVFPIFLVENSKRINYSLVFVQIVSVFLYFIFTINLGIFCVWRRYDIFLVTITILAALVRAIRAYATNDLGESKEHLAYKMRDFLEGTSIFLETHACFTRGENNIPQWLKVCLLNPGTLTVFSSILAEYSVPMKKTVDVLKDETDEGNKKEADKLHITNITVGL